jgi:hypothetical protein
VATGRPAVGNNHGVAGDDEAPTGGGDDPTARPDDDDAWGVNAAIGAAAIAARTATDVAGAVSTSAPGRAIEGAARWLTRPLAREGEEVRGRIEEEAGPAAQKVMRQVTPGVVEAVGINEVLEAIDVDALLDRIDINRLVDRIDVGAIVSKVDVNDLVANVDVQGIIERVDVQGIIERVDIQGIIDRVDLDKLLDSIDLNALLGRLDLDAVLSKVDINALVQRLDMDALVANTELGSIIAESTSGVASHALDAVRSQGVGMDNFIGRVTNRVMRRDPAELPAGPPLLVDGQLALPSPAPEPGSVEEAS